MARRIEDDCRESGSTEAFVARAYALCFARAPKGEELGAGAAFIAKQSASYTSEERTGAGTLALADFCQVLFCLNEFLYAE